MVSALFIADSRGRGLEPAMAQIFSPAEYAIVWRNGLSLLDTPNFAYQSICDLEPSLIYILAGICDLTRISCRDPWTAALRLPTVDQLVESYLLNMDWAFSCLFSIHTVLGYKPMIIFPTQTGLHFATYNSYPDNLVSPSQAILDDAITNINRNIVTQNSNMAISTPFLASTVHKRLRHKNRTSYSHLADGCHPTEALSACWADKLYENMCVNLDKYDTYSLINHIY